MFNIYFGNLMLQQLKGGVMEVYIITFKQGNYTVAAFCRLENMGFKDIRLSSVPFSIKSECDLCIKTFNYEMLKSILRECRGKYPINNVYSSIKSNGTYLYKVLPLVTE